MGKVVMKTKITKREKGYLYFLDKNGDIAQVQMARTGERRSKKHRVVARLGIKKKPGFLYYIDKKVNVCEAKMQRGRVKRRKKKSR